MKNIDQTIISQYASSPTLVQLIHSVNDWLRQDVNFEKFYTHIWGVLLQRDVSADEFSYGLDVWGRIVGVGRVLTVQEGPWFGFAEAADSEGFDQAPFWNGVPATSNFRLANQAYLRLILAKAAANITDGSIPSINKILMNLFPGRGNAYVTDGSNAPSAPWFGFDEQADSEGFEQAPFWGGPGNAPSSMTMVYTFQFSLEPFEVAIVTTSGVLPKSVGVLASAVYLT